MPELVDDQVHEDVARLLCGECAWKLGHGEAVAAAAYRTALALGIPEQHAARIRLAGCLHDIGKTQMDEAVLRQAAPLTVEDWRQIRLHPVFGEQILIGEGLTDLAPWVRAHHERYDGLGYPDGESGAAIPLEARIIAVADAYDAMVSGRPYRRPMSDAEARDELQREAGTQFDPDVVAALLRTLPTEADGTDAAPARRGWINAV